MWLGLVVGINRRGRVRERYKESGEEGKEGGEKRDTGREGGGVKGPPYVPELLNFYL